MARAFDTEDARSIEACDQVMRFEDLTQRSWPFNVLYGGSDFQVTHIRSHDNREPGQRRERLRNLCERGVLELDGNGRLGLSASKGGTDDQKRDGDRNGQVGVLGHDSAPHGDR